MLETGDKAQTAPGGRRNPFQHLLQHLTQLGALEGLDQAPKIILNKRRLIQASLSQRFPCLTQLLSVFIHFSANKSQVIDTNQLLPAGKGDLPRKSSPAAPRAPPSNKSPSSKSGNQRPGEGSECAAKNILQGLTVEL